MLIYIPSSGRASRQTTLKSIPESWRQQTYVVVPSDEEARYRSLNKGANLLTTPKELKGIGPTRQWIIEHAYTNARDKKCLMLDDDLVFSRRREDKRTLFYPGGANEEEMEEVLDDVVDQLDDYAHVAISHREGANRQTENYLHNGRTLRALAYQVPALYEAGLKFTKIPVMEDFYVNLGLLAQGKASCIVNWMVQNQHGSNLAGGCSQYRTMEMQAAASYALKAKYPRYVKVVKKPDKGSWGGERTDVIIQWKKAYGDAVL